MKLRMGSLILMIVAVAFGFILLSCKGNSSTPWISGTLGVYVSHQTGTDLNSGGTGTDLNSGGTGTDLNSGGTGTDLNSGGTGTDLGGGTDDNNGNGGNNGNNGENGNGGNGNGGNGKNDLDLSLFSNVTVTIENIQVVNTGTGAECDLLTVPTSLNLADLNSNILQLVAQAQCPTGPFNRIHIAFDSQIQLVSKETCSVTMCSFVSYNNNASRKPDVVFCPDNSDQCSININGAVNILPEQGSKLTLDIKELTLVSDVPCEITMKLSPLHSAGK